MDIRRRFRRCGTLAGIAISVVTVVGCSSSSSSSSSAGLTAAQLAQIPSIVRLSCSKDQGLKGKTIGISWEEELGLVNQLNADIEEFAKLSNCGVNLKIVNANGNTAQQITQAQELVTQGASLLFEQPAAPGGWSAVISQAKSASIPVINWSSVAVTGATMNVNVSQAETGAADAPAAASWLKKYYGGKGEVAMIVSQTDIGYKARAAAFKAALLKLDPGAEFIATAPGGYESASAAENTALSLIEAHPSLRMIFADWDADTLGAAQAAKEAGKTNPHQFFIAGEDGTDAQLALMAKPNAVLQVTGAPLFRYDPGVIVNNMLRLLMGQKLPPTRVLVPGAVTVQNLASFQKLVNDPFSPVNANVFNSETLYYNTPETTENPVPSGPPIPGALVN